MLNFSLKRSDNKFKIPYTISNTDQDSAPVDLTGCTVQMLIGNDAGLIVNKAASVDDPVNGLVSCTLLTQDTIFSGLYNAEFVVTFPDGTTTSYPRNGYMTVSIQKNVDPNATDVYVSTIAAQQGDFETKLDSILNQAGNISMSAVNEYEWTATAGQLTYTLPVGVNYDMGSKWFNVFVGGALIDPSLVSRNSANQFTINTAPANILAGMSVYAKWTEPIVPVTSGHHATHYSTGSDAIDVTQLMNYQSAIATPLADKASYPILTGEVGVVNKIYPYGDIRRYGAVGNGVTDSTTAIQNAINNAYTLSFSVYVPMGGYVVSQSLQLPVAIKIIGNSDNPSMFYGSTYGTSKCYIVSTCQNVFVPSATNTPKGCCLYLDGIEFRNNYSPRNGATVFSGLELFNAYIAHNSFNDYGTIVYGKITQVSKVCFNTFGSIEVAFIDGPLNVGLGVTGGSIIDAQIHDNYFNGAPTKNATCFSVNQFTTSQITNNYFDFFKVCFDYRNFVENVVISHNIFDYCYRAITTLTYLQVAAGIASTTFTNNIIRKSKKTDCSPYFTNMDSDMNTKPWGGIEAPKGFYQMIVANNQVLSADQFLNIQTYTVYAVRIANNSLLSVTTPITYIVNKGGNTSDQTDIYIQDLMYIPYTTFPNPTITGTGITSFNGQIVRYNGKILYNDNGTWKDSAGVAVTS